MVFSFSLVINPVINCIICLLLFSQTFINFEQIKLDNCVRHNLLLTEKMPVRGVS